MPGALHTQEARRFSAVIMDTIDGYKWSDADQNCSHEYLLPVLQRELARTLDGTARTSADKRLFELGCGNGSVAAFLAAQGWDVTGVDPSSEGIGQANRAYPQLKLYQGSAYDELAETYGRYPVVTSLEVVEHVYAPRKYAQTLFSLLEPGGTAILSTPFHGYWKNLALALSGKLDAHFTALWDHGHIKFWSVKTLSDLLCEAGFVDLRFVRVGRVPPLAKSMLAIAVKP
jgi:2-polyprenyl-3-methyl-5-hydroxy-6-metoxy-1,4-benzoquinol methylase